MAQHGRTTRALLILAVVVLGGALAVAFLRPWVQARIEARAAAVAAAHVRAAREALYPWPGSGLKPDYDKAVREYRYAVEAAPWNLEAHRGLIAANRTSQFVRSGRGLPDARADASASLAAGRTQLAAFYSALETRHPREPAVRWAMGQLYPDEPDRAAAFYREAIARDPGFAPGYLELGRLAQKLDDRPRVREMFSKAADAEPTRAEYAYLAAGSLPPEDRAGFERGLADILERFPRSQEAAFILGEAARRAQTADERVRLLERQHRDYPDPGRATSLFHAYLASDPEKAAAFARTILTQNSQSWVAPMWTPLVGCGEALLEARHLAGDHRFAEARALLDRTTAKWPCWLTPLHLERARIDRDDGGPSRALDRLIDVATIQRTAELEAALDEFGAAAGRSKEMIEGEVWHRRMRSAAVMENFTLPRLDGKGIVRLADLRGQVVLVNFWYPG